MEIEKIRRKVKRLSNILEEHNIEFDGFWELMDQLDQREADASIVYEDDVVQIARFSWGQLRYLYRKDDYSEWEPIGTNSFPWQHIATVMTEKYFLPLGKGMTSYDDYVDCHESD